MGVEAFEVDVAPIEPDSSPVNPTMSVWLPINEEIADMIKVDDNIHVMFDAQVIGIDNESGGIDTDNYTMRVKVQRIKVGAEGNEFEEMHRDDMLEEMHNNDEFVAFEMP